VFLIPHSHSIELSLIDLVTLELLLSFIEVRSILAFDSVQLLDLLLQFLDVSNPDDISTDDDLILTFDLPFGIRFPVIQTAQIRLITQVIRFLTNGDGLSNHSQMIRNQARP
jgi:hypothetical protein